jgi:hypothetical protein
LESKGGRNLVEVNGGAFYTPAMKEGGKAKLVSDAELAGRLWEWTEEQLKVRGY